MPWTGQDKTASAPKRGLEQSAATRRSVASGERGRVPEGNNAVARGLQRRGSVSESIRSGNYFGENTALRRQAELNQAKVSLSRESLQRFKD